MQGVQVQSLVREIKIPHAAQPEKKKKKVDQWELIEIYRTLQPKKIRIHILFKYAYDIL